MRFFLVAVALCSVTTAHAKIRTDTAADSSEAIVVTGQQVKYGAKSTRTATKSEYRRQGHSPGPNHDHQPPDPRPAATIREPVARLRAGASYGGGEGNRDQVVLRGNSSTADFFVDGLRDDVQYFRDLYNVDRVKILKGPNAMIFGRGGGGGVVNRVLKRPSLGTSRDFSASADLWSDFWLTGDVDQPLGKFWAFVSTRWPKGARASAIIAN